MFGILENLSKKRRLSDSQVFEVVDINMTKLTVDVCDFSNEANNFLIT
jgi:hypothetical protein